MTHSSITNDKCLVFCAFCAVRFAVGRSPLVGGGWVEFCKDSLRNFAKFFNLLAAKARFVG